MSIRQRWTTGIGCILLALCVYISILSCTILVVDANGAPVPDAKVVVMHHQMVSVVGAYMGTTDAQGTLDLTGLALPHPMGSLSVHVVTPNDRGGGTSLWQWTRSAKIETGAPPTEYPEYFSYEAPQDVWTSTKRAIQAKDWKMAPGKAKYVPITSGQGT